MPYFLEVISFEALRHDNAGFGAIAQFGQTQTASALEFDMVERLDGCVRYGTPLARVLSQYERVTLKLSVVGGYELEDERRGYVITGSYN